MRLVAIFFSFGLLIGSCGKYEEGPLISLRSKEQRVANQWKVADAHKYGVDITPEFKNYRYVFDKFGNAEAHIYINPDLDIVLKGDWELKNDSEILELDLEGDSLGTQVNWEYEYRIIALKEAEMQLVRTSDELELTLEPF